MVVVSRGGDLVFGICAHGNSFEYGCLPVRSLSGWKPSDVRKFNVPKEYSDPRSAEGTGWGGGTISGSGRAGLRVPLAVALSQHFGCFCNVSWCAPTQSQLIPLPAIQLISDLLRALLDRGPLPSGGC